MSDDADHLAARTITDDCMRVEALRAACEMGVAGEPAATTITRAIAFIGFLAPELALPSAVADIEASGTPSHIKGARLFRIPAQGRA
ncbi:MAG: hypothetical protein E6Q97_31165 [Desulfurellales bacterium]|nr:MAG: hypothetical protein E6Q97_31165 [Desulfurellales bacterium]